MDVNYNHSVHENGEQMSEIVQVNISFVVPICTCSIHAVGLCTLPCTPIFNLLGILPPQATAQAKAKPKPAVFDGNGLAYRF
jgi:hypothetical protein